MLSPGKSAAAIAAARTTPLPARYARQLASRSITRSSPRKHPEAGDVTILRIPDDLHEGNPPCWSLIGTISGRSRPSKAPTVRAGHLASRGTRCCGTNHSTGGKARWTFHFLFHATKSRQWRSRLVSAASLARLESSPNPWDACRSSAIVAESREQRTSDPTRHGRSADTEDHDERTSKWVSAVVAAALLAGSSLAPLAASAQMQTSASAPARPRHPAGAGSSAGPPASQPPPPAS